MTRLTLAQTNVNAITQEGRNATVTLKVLFFILVSYIWADPEARLIGVFYANKTSTTSNFLDDQSNSEVPFYHSEVVFGIYSI